MRSSLCVGMAALFCSTFFAAAAEASCRPPDGSCVCQSTPATDIWEGEVLSVNEAGAAQVRAVDVHQGSVPPGDTRTIQEGSLAPGARVLVWNSPDGSWMTGAIDTAGDFRCGPGERPMPVSRALTAAQLPMERCNDELKTSAYRVECESLGCASTGPALMVAPAFLAAGLLLRRARRS